MIGKIIKNPGFQSLISKLIVLYLIYSKKVTLLGLFYFSSFLPHEAVMAWDMAALCFLMDYIVVTILNQHIDVHVSLKDIKNGETSSIFYRDAENLGKVRLTVNVRSKDKRAIKLLKSILGKDRIVFKLKWSHDTWLAFERMDGVLPMDENALLFADTDGICVDLFTSLSDEETYAEIINTPLIMACDMGDKSEGQITHDLIWNIKSPLKRKIFECIISAWIDIDYWEHKVKVV